MVEMFARSERLYGIKYANYIGDGDSKTFKGVADSHPYGNFEVKKRVHRSCAEGDGHTIEKPEKKVLVGKVN